MRSRELQLERYDTDKIPNGYLERYDPVLAPWLGKEIVLLEIGVHNGGSLLLWRDYFERGTIVGVDVNLPKQFKPAERIHLYEGSQADPEFLSRVATATAPGGFDIIIDDAAHIGRLTKKAFWHLFENHLKPGGLYVIEDWGTGYWDDWPDGKGLNLAAYRKATAAPASFWSKLVGKRGRKRPMPSHAYGMVGFIKQLIDEQGAHDVTRRLITRAPERSSKFEQLIICPSIVFVRKADASRWQDARETEKRS